MDFEKMIEELRGNLTQDEFSIHEMSFRVDKLPAIDGHDLLEEIRFELSGSYSNTPEDKLASGSAIILLFLRLNPSFVKKVRSKLFGHAFYKGNGAQDWVKLGGAEGQAFANLEPTHIYEVLVRCLAVNFTHSLNAAMSKLEDQS